MKRIADRRWGLGKRFGKLAAVAVIVVAAIAYGSAMMGASSESASTSNSSSPAAGQNTAPSANEGCTTSNGERVACAGGLAAGFESWDVQMWQLINRDRAAAPSDETKGQERSLEWDARLAAVARQHSEEMASKGFFGHQGADGSMPDVRITKMGIRWRASGENIAKYPDIVQAEAAFMNEPRFQENHRANILNPNYTHVGVGIVKGADGMFYITQEFAQLQ